MEFYYFIHKVSDLLMDVFLVSQFSMIRFTFSLSVKQRLLNVRSDRIRILTSVTRNLDIANHLYRVPLKAGLNVE